MQQQKSLILLTTNSMSSNLYLGIFFSFYVYYYYLIILFLSFTLLFHSSSTLYFTFLIVLLFKLFKYIITQGWRTIQSIQTLYSLNQYNTIHYETIGNNHPNKVLVMMSQVRILVHYHRMKPDLQQCRHTSRCC